MSEKLEVEDRPAMDFVLELTKVLIDHAFFSQKTFGSDDDVGPLGPIKHLHEETGEILDAPTDPIEYVDMMFLTADSIRRFLHQINMNPYDFVRHARAKLSILELRKWPEPKDGEPRKHIKQP